MRTGGEKKEVGRKRKEKMSNARVQVRPRARTGRKEDRWSWKLEEVIHTSSLMVAVWRPEGEVSIYPNTACKAEMQEGREGKFFFSVFSSVHQSSCSVWCVRV